MRKAIPTEYMGVKYRSKSEAILAYCLYNSKVISHLQYEPKGSGKNWLHSWDFSFRVKDKKYLVEYKPSFPTDTYVENLTKKLHSNRTCLLIMGSPWNKLGPFNRPYRIERLLDNRPPRRYKDVFGINKLAKAAKKYRFDLK